MTVFDKMREKGFEILSGSRFVEKAYKGNGFLHAFDEKGSGYVIQMQDRALRISREQFPGLLRHPVVHMRHIQSPPEFEAIVPPCLSAVDETGEILGNVPAALGLKTSHGVIVRYTNRSVWTVGAEGYERRFRHCDDEFPSVPLTRIPEAEDSIFKDQQQ